MKNFSGITDNFDVTTKKYVDDGLAEKANSADLATVATSGSYNDLSDKPTIPAAANNGKLTIQKNGTDVQTFTANQSSSVTANITVPTKASDVNALSLDGGTIKKSKTIKMDASANSDGANLKWGTVNSKNPYIGYASDQVDGTFVVGSLLGTNYASGLAIGGGSGNLLWKGAKVATTSDIPTVNNGKLTIQKNGTDVAIFTANQSTNSTANITVPVKVSELTNDSGYTTNKGTVTQVKINGTTKSPDSAGLVDLGAVGGDGATDAVKYTPQTLTASQKTQARSNIGAGTGNGTVTGVQINGSTKGTSGVVDLGYMQVRVNGTTYTADSDGLIDLGTIGGTTTYTSMGNDIY